ncbi:MAG TPA: zinc ribbon domain-containing protein, partial [Ktedonobacterales bacterium]|nr:zinc ribbon domain-containing protein [Ktedonobacterales bacterium]
PSSRPRQYGPGVESSPYHPPHTSQDCSSRGERVLMLKSLSVRTHVCSCCGLVLDRDENAAKNRETAGQALRGGVA